MITPKDIQNIITANREIFATKEDLKEGLGSVRHDLADVEQRLDSKIEAIDTRLVEKTDQILTAVDAYGKKAETFFQELVVANHKIERHEKWLHQIAEKLNVRLEY